MTKEQFGEWRNHPATQFFRQFLRDRAKRLGEQMHEAWLTANDLFEKDSQEARGRILELVDIENLSFAQIEEFYREKHDSEALKDNSI